LLEHLRRAAEGALGGGLPVGEHHVGAALLALGGLGRAARAEAARRLRQPLEEVALDHRSFACRDLAGRAAELALELAGGRVELLLATAGFALETLGFGRR